MAQPIEEAPPFTLVALVHGADRPASRCHQASWVVAVSRQRARAAITDVFVRISGFGRLLGGQHRILSRGPSDPVRAPGSVIETPVGPAALACGEAPTDLKRRRPMHASTGIRAGYGPIMIPGG